MKQPKGPVHPTPEMPEMTGRDGAVDFIAKVNTVDPSQDYDHFAHVLGCALIDAWSDLPQEIQERLFEGAVRSGHKTERDEMLREQLAKFLHDHHR
jgi:hypothetical protein